jgi:hypothetical protein
MPSGGARATSGPPPDPQSLRQGRRGDDGGWTEIPAKARAGKPPQWPMEDQSPREAAIWALLWKMPQAAQWKRLRLEWSVALVARLRERAEWQSSSAALLMELRQHEDSLGLTVPGLLRNRWRIAEPIPAARQAPRASAAAPESAKTRLRAITGGQRSG